MKKDFKNLLIWFVLYFLIQQPIRDVLLHGKSFSLEWLFNSKGLVLTLSTMVSFFFFSFIAYITFIKYYNTRKWIGIGVGLLLASFLPIMFRYLTQEVLFPNTIGFRNYNINYGYINYIRDNLYFALNYMTFGIIYFFIRYVNYKESNEKLLILNNQKMELSLLRAQINPHFLLNSMNNIYSLVYSKSELALDAIDKLSQILKYTLYQNKEEVRLAEEVSYVNNYIELQKMRYNYEPQIDIQIDETSYNIIVPQFILLPIVENAFKHADLRDSRTPFLVKIVSKIDGPLEIFTSNKIALKEKDIQGGIGLENISKRLQLIYGDLHEFRFLSKNNSFELYIKLPVK